MIEDLNPTIRGWGNYFAIGTVAHLFRALDAWIRTRLRSKVRGSKARRVSPDTNGRVDKALLPPPQLDHATAASDPRTRNPPPWLPPPRV